jgi:hypothetical protein
MLRKLLESMNCNAAPMWRFLCAKQLKMFKCWRPKKKSAWTDLDRVSFKKIFKESNVEIEKSAWTGLDKSKKGLFSGKCLLIFFRTGHPGVAKVFCTSMACP